MRFLLLNILVYLSTSVLARTVSIENVRVWAAPDSTRVVFDISGPVEHELSMLNAPYRTVIDLKDTKIQIPGSPKFIIEVLQRFRFRDRLNL